MSPLVHGGYQREGDHLGSVRGEGAGALELARRACLTHEEDGMSVRSLWSGHCGFVCDLQQLTHASRAFEQMLSLLCIQMGHVRIAAQ